MYPIPVLICLVIASLLRQSYSATSAWEHLYSLKLQAILSAEGVSTAIEILQGFHPTNLTNITLDLQSEAIGVTTKWISGESSLCGVLDHALVQFPHPTLSFSLNKPIRSSRYNFWSSQLGTHFPAVQNRGVLSITSQPGSFIMAEDE